MSSNHYYLIHIQYCGYRFHGWAKQPDVKTIHLMIDKTIRFVMKHDNFKTLGTSRTDALVSANHMVFEVFTGEPLEESEFLKAFNINLPADIRATKIEEVDGNFNVIQSPKTKEYIYLFAFGKKHHPFAAPLMSLLPFDLNIGAMMEGAKLFQGAHNFRKYCTKPSPNVDFNRQVSVSEIKENNIYTANFFPEESYAYHIESKGFMRHQIRLMMGQLILLGKGEISMTAIQDSLTTPDDTPLDYIAPASGLILNHIAIDT